MLNNSKESMKIFTRKVIFEQNNENIDGQMRMSPE
jgi:hypothetical protein